MNAIRVSLAASILLSLTAEHSAAAYCSPIGNSWVLNDVMSVRGWPSNGAVNTSVTLGSNLITAAGYDGSAWWSISAAATGTTGALQQFGLSPDAPPYPYTPGWSDANDFGLSFGGATAPFPSLVFAQYFTNVGYGYFWTIRYGSAGFALFDPYGLEVAGSASSEFNNTSFAVDNVGADGGNPSKIYMTGPFGTCDSGADQPHGACIENTPYTAFTGTSTWTKLSGSPGAAQITPDLWLYDGEDGLPANQLYALDSSGAVWSRQFPSGSPWIKASTAICDGGGTIGEIVQIAAIAGDVYGIVYNEGNPGFVYRYTGCWGILDPSVKFVSINANSGSVDDGLREAGPVSGTDAEGNLWTYCSCIQPYCD